MLLASCPIRAAAFQRLLDLTGHAAAIQQLMHRNQSSWFSKEKYEERKLELKEELSKGYFDDYKHLRDTGGKVFPATRGLIPAEAAKRFPQGNVMAQGPSGLHLVFPEALQQGPGHAAVVATSCRAGAQEVVDLWMKPLVQAYSSTTYVQLLHVICVDMLIFRVPPFKWVLSSSVQPGTVPQQLYYFENQKEFRRELEMDNALSGYVYAVDGRGRIRWRGSGFPESGDTEDLVQAVHKVLQQ